MLSNLHWPPSVQVTIEKLSWVVLATRDVDLGRQRRVSRSSARPCNLWNRTIMLCSVCWVLLTEDLPESMFLLLFC